MLTSIKLKQLILISSLICPSLHGWWFDIVPIKKIIEQHPEILYQKCFDELQFSLNSFTPDPTEPNQGSFKECFIVTIPDGVVQSEYGFTVINKKFIQEMIWGDQPHSLRHVKNLNPVTIIKVPGKVAVITQVAYFNYYHWLIEVLGRLALLEMHNIQYDWLYVQKNTPLMKKTLELWGINPSKIISPPQRDSFAIQADQIILPSYLINTNIGFSFAHPCTTTYVKNKLVSAVKEKNTPHSFSKKVFISRQDTHRRITNEDDIFQVLKCHGFKKYTLSSLSIEDQILLFDGADIVIGEHGAGLVNIIFCKPNTHIIEIFQALKTTCFWSLANMLNLKYTAIKTMEFEPNYMTAWRSQAEVPLDQFYELLKTL